ncbi:NmrA/HSCARG family protein [Streptomyces turgidiscabies]|uniref:NAD dependent epimerase/dehydratase family protein n=1 Tax=Streptomyces turgidiscabies (strain Car8) TaxID=698760 RepID=L7EQM5_STRT8|nr:MULTISPECIES: NmrA/HSCARG family protein [Streptomyces]ELP61352.1 NAD dependent epimerase/dehydratase family protein [Streptomyces turgidiscabies Car8]MDX3493508.1 NmrA/HSCARG family protein [Streptomyces turgidiscabies]GAQ76805.1 NAD(P)H azoreductase [Streptomyces turgidiscabies]
MTQTIYQPVIAVTGATGAQGGATARALLRHGSRVRALTRRPSSTAAEELRRLGAEVAYADFDDRAGLDAALAGVDALFAMSTRYGGDTGRGAGNDTGDDTDTEVRQAVALLDAAAASGTVRHIVFTSAANADRGTGIPHFDTKHQVELRLRKLGIPWTVIAPGLFMDNYTGEWTLSGLREGRFALPLPADLALPFIPAADIGAFAALVLRDPEKFAGRRIDLASDRVTCSEIAGILSAVCGRPIEFTQVPLARIEAHSADLAAMFRYFTASGLNVDVEGLRRDHPEVGWQRFADWAGAQSWDLTPAR